MTIAAPITPSKHQQRLNENLTSLHNRLGLKTASPVIPASMGLIEIYTYKIRNR